MALPPIFPDFNASAGASYRPAVSSPLSSSPIRATTTTPPPLSPRDANARRDIQSSPIPTSAAKFKNSKFASRPTRPNPVNQKREVAQEGRRKLFLKNVRQRAEDKRWEMRGGEQELLKLEWFSLNKDLRQAKNADLDGIMFESDIEEAARVREEALSRPLAAIREAPEPNPAADEMMVDALEQEQLVELEALEALAASVPDGPIDEQPQWQQQRSQKPPDSPHWSDDDDYDELFMDYLSQEQQNQSQAHASSGEMDLS
ncbi:hypothetical protein VP1G_05820 [Cytospora mali]|uniref:Uncharacterized protein n=1 Tax=Cytospora mali TaxID=578113 RepID=A0A194V3R9_CYTMA|nr:hypothetical protein VP1G_05820 [Valsa mali var. pyri (nom. inval.)]